MANKLNFISLSRTEISGLTYAGKGATLLLQLM